MAYALYCEINLFCIAILCLILFWQRGESTGQQINILFRQVIISTIVILAVDAFWALLDNKGSSPFVLSLNRLVNSLYFILSAYICFSWFLFVDAKIARKRPPIAGKKVLVSLIPLAITIMLAVLSFFHDDLIFTISLEGTYARGKFNVLGQLFPNCYMIMIVILIAKDLKDGKPNKQERKEDYTLLAFIVLPLLGTIVTFLKPGLPILWVSDTFAIMLVNGTFQRFQISTDSLTGLYNRRQFDKDLEKMIEEAVDVVHTLTISDVNKFKKINDALGHNEGDHALQVTASLLQKACEGEISTRIYRYGGDEFAILGILINPEKFRNRAYTLFEQEQKENNHKFRLSISMGIRTFSIQDKDSQAIVRDADTDLYREKKSFR